MPGNTVVTVDLVYLLAGFGAVLWAIFTVYARLKAEARDMRILINLLCRHAGIDPAKILAGNE